MSRHPFAITLICLAALTAIAMGPREHNRIVIAEGGSGGYLPSHSLAAYTHAYAMGASYIGIDCVLSKDDQLICADWLTLDSGTNVSELFPDLAREDGRWYAIDLTAAEIATLRRSTPERKSAAPSPLPTLDDALALVSHLNRATRQRVGVAVRVLDPAFHAGEERRAEAVLAETLKRQGYARRAGEVIVLSDDGASLLRTKRAFGQNMRLVLCIDGEERLSRGRLRGFAEWGWGVAPTRANIEPAGEWDGLGEAWVKEAQDMGLWVFISGYDGNSASIARCVRRTGGGYGADGVFSTYPDVAIGVTEEIHAEEDALRDAMNEGN